MTRSEDSPKTTIPGIGKRVKALQGVLGFTTQIAMAEWMGVTPGTLSRYIQTDRCPDPPILLRLALHGVSVDALLCGDRPAVDRVQVGDASADAPPEVRRLYARIDALIKRHGLSAVRNIDAILKLVRMPEVRGAPVVAVPKQRGSGG